MTSKRKAEIQRKLSLTVVPRPPADLLDRIKGDIPRYLNVEAERERFSRSIAFNLRIAASIIVLISVAGLLFMLSPGNTPNAIPELAMRTKQEAQTPKPVVTPPRAAMDEVQVDIFQTASAPPAHAQSAPAPEEMRVERAVRRDSDAERAEQVVAGVESYAEGGVVGGVAGGIAGGVSADDERSRELAPPQRLAEAAPASVPAPEPVPAQAPALAA